MPRTLVEFTPFRNPGRGTLHRHDAPSRSARSPPTSGRSCATSASRRSRRARRVHVDGRAGGALPARGVAAAHRHVGRRVRRRRPGRHRGLVPTRRARPHLARRHVGRTPSTGGTGIASGLVAHVVAATAGEPLLLHVLPDQRAGPGALPDGGLRPRRHRRRLRRRQPLSACATTRPPPNSRHEHRTRPLVHRDRPASPSRSSSPTRRSARASSPRSPRSRSTATGSAGTSKGNAGADWLTLDAALLRHARRTGADRDRRRRADLHSYRGRLDLSAGPGAAPSYAAPLFDTGDERYAWINGIQAVAKGALSDGGTTLVYEIYEVR